MKDRTKEAASLIRIIAGIMLFFGMVLSIVLILVGIMAIVSKNNSMTAIFQATGATFIVSGVLFAFSQLFIYAILNGFSVIVENSDRSAIENALFEIADMRKPRENETE